MVGMSVLENRDGKTEVKNRLLLFSIIGVSLILAAVIFYYFQKDKPVMVGLVAWSASGAVVGSSELNAGDLFLEEHPNSLIRIFPVDDQWNPDLTRPAIEEAMRNGVRFFVTSHPSKCAVVMMELFKEPSALAIVAAATSPVLTGKDDYTLRIIADAEQEQRSIARYVNNMKGERILVLQDEGNLPYTDPAFKFFSEELETLGKWRIVHNKLVVSNFSPDELTPIMKEHYDALFILAGSYQAAIGNIAQLFHYLHPNAPILLTPWARSPGILENAGPAISKIILPSQYPSRHDDPSLDSYFSRFQNRFGYEPHAMTIGVRQALELLDIAFSKGYRTPEDVKNYLVSAKTHETSLGLISFDQYGDVAQPFCFTVDLERELK